MDVLLDSFPSRPLLDHPHRHHPHPQPQSLPPPPPPHSTPSHSHHHRWTDSIDLLRGPLPPTEDHPSTSTPSPSPITTTTIVSSSSLTPTPHRSSTMTHPPPPPCCQQDDGRRVEGVYYHYHHSPFCRACQGATATPSNAPSTDGPSSLYFNYLKFASGGRPTPRVPPPASSCSPYSTAGPQKPYTRGGIDGGQGAAAVEASPFGDRPIAAECRLTPAPTRRRPYFRVPSGFSFRFLSKPKATTSGGSVDSSLVENKVEGFVGGGGGKAGKAIVTKNRSTGERKRNSGRYRSQRLIIVVVFLFSLFIAAAASVLGIVLMWSPMHDSASSSLATDLGRNLDVNADHVTGGGDVQYITVASSLEKATPDSFGWAFYSRGSTRGSKYTIINKPLTFYSAQEHCQRLGGYLVHINTLREQLFIEDFLTQELENLGSSPDAGIGFWIGAKRARGSHEGTCMFEQWKWVDSYGRSLSTIAGLTAFVPGKPDNQYNPEECLFMSYRERSDENRFLKWDDAPCDLNSIGAIKAVCEVEIR